MSFDWYDYYRLSFELKRIKDNPINIPEAFLRSSVSRAYYSSFHIALNYAQQHLDFNPARNGNDHKNLPVIYRSTKMFDISDWLVDLRNYRTKCDYEDNVQNLEKICITSIYISNELITLIKKLANKHTN